jgi:hypothetical protein
MEDARRHKPILDGLRERDEERSRTAMRDHFPLLENSFHAERKMTKFRDSQFVQALFSQLLSKSPAPVGRVPTGMLGDALEAGDA